MKEWYIPTFVKKQLEKSFAEIAKTNPAPSYFDKIRLEITGQIFAEALSHEALKPAARGEENVKQYDAYIKRSFCCS